MTIKDIGKDTLGLNLDNLEFEGGKSLTTGNHNDHNVSHIDSHGSASSHHTAKPVEEFRSLKDIEFTDLFFSVNGEAFIRGRDDSEGPLSEIPTSALEDLEILHADICERGENEADGSFFADYDGMRFRVTRLDDVNGVWYTLRRLKWPLPKLPNLKGIPPRVIEQLGILGRAGSHGLILVAGATSQGKTTTASALLTEYLTYYGDVAVTIEDPIELPLSGPHGHYGYCFQTSVDDGDFKDAMKKTMRRSPRFIYLGEIRSGDEASVALRAALTGHLVISTIHAGNCIEAIDGMIKYVSATGEPAEIARQNLASGLLAVVHQKLAKAKNIPGKILRVQTLFSGKDQSVKTLIRSGKTEQLTSEIARQATLIQHGKAPV